MEEQLLQEIRRVMFEKGIKPSDFADKKGISRQSVSQYMTGKRGLLTDTGKDLLEFLDVRIVLVPMDKPES